MVDEGCVAFGCSDITSVGPSSSVLTACRVTKDPGKTEGGSSEVDRWCSGFVCVDRPQCLSNITLDVKAKHSCGSLVRTTLDM